jgi:pyridoxal phosphate enzyme (YggS family)
VSVSDNVEKVRARIARTGRNPDEVSIVAVTKGFTAERCREALAAGLTILGENRVHEALAKMEELGPGTEWHLIGHLQTNKVRTASGHFSLIQSVDSVRLASLIAAIDPHQAVLVEVNTSREPQKSGVDPDSAPTVIKEVARLLDLRGLMTVGPANADPKPAFEELTRLRDAAQESLGQPLPILSMGMSGDFEAAVAAGSTMLRLGQLLFGPRPA